MESYRKTLNAASIANHLETQIQNGDLPPGTPLPTVRELATRMSVNPSTVATAYRNLRAAGMIVTNGRKGSQVAPPPAQLDLSVSFPTGLEDFASGNVDVALLPKPEADWFSQQTDQIGYEANRDDDALLALSKQWLAAQRIPHDKIGFFSGTLDAMERILRQRVRPGASVLVEDPCWPPVIALLKNLHLKAIPLDLDEDGARVPDASHQDVAGVILTLRAHNPTGISLSPQRFEEWKQFLEGNPKITLIMDDYWGPLSKQPLPDLSDDLPKNWFYLMSVSKALGPDLRLCIATGNTRLMAELKQHQLAGPRWVSLLLQRLTAHLWQKMIDDNAFDAVAQEYENRRRLFVQAMQNHQIRLSVREGLHFWVPVQDEALALQVFSAEGIAVQSGQAFRLRTSKAIRISVAHLTGDKIPQIADLTAKAIKATSQTVL